MQIAAHHDSFIRRHAATVAHLAVAIPLSSDEDVAARRHICRHRVLRGQWGFRALYEGNVNGGIGGGRGAAVKHRDVRKRASVIFVEALHPWGVWREEELLEGVSQSRTWLGLTEFCLSRGQMMLLAGHRSLRQLTLWDTSKT